MDHEVHRGARYLLHECRYNRSGGDIAHASFIVNKHAVRAVDRGAGDRVTELHSVESIAQDLLGVSLQGLIQIGECRLVLRAGVGGSERRN